MKLVKSLFVVIALSVAAVMPAFANEGLPSTEPALQEGLTDAGLVFETDAQPMQVASLSLQEMEETKGAWVWTAAGIAAGSSWQMYQYYRNTSPYHRTAWGYAGAAGAGALLGARTSVYGLAGWGAKAYGFGPGAAMSGAYWYFR